MSIEVNKKTIKNTSLDYPLNELNDEGEYFAEVLNNFDYLLAEELYEMDTHSDEEYFEFISGAIRSAPEVKDPGEELTSGEGKSYE
jgi:hypothetical protein